MPVKLRKVNGLLPKKYHVMPDQICKECVISTRESSREGFNNALLEIGRLQIGLNRDKLAKILANHTADWDFKLAEEIIASEHEILEMKNERD